MHFNTFFIEIVKYMQIVTAKILNLPAVRVVEKKTISMHKTYSHYPCGHGQQAAGLVLVRYIRRGFISVWLSVQGWLFSPCNQKNR